MNEVFPGVDAFQPELAYRSLSRAEGAERVGSGFMDKSGKERDSVDLDFPRYVLVYVLRGKGRYIDRDGREYALEPGAYFLRIPGRRHSVWLDPKSGWRECFLDFGKNLGDALRRLGALDPDSPVGRGGRIDLPLVEAIWHVTQRLKTADESHVPELALEVSRLVLTALRRTATIPKAGHPVPSRKTIETACRYLSEHLTDKNDLRHFCRSRGWGYEKFRKDFKYAMGLSPGQYRLRRRLDIACQLLAERRLDVGEIAAELGFSSLYDFSARFKKHLGMSPARYRGKGGDRKGGAQAGTSDAISAGTGAVKTTVSPEKGQTKRKRSA